jgi:hypothetical protein
VVITAALVVVVVVMVVINLFPLFECALHREELGAELYSYWILTQKRTQFAIYAGVAHIASF